MYRSLLVLASSLLLSGQCLAQQPLLGTYKLIKNDIRLDGEPVQPMGKSQHGYLVITPKLFLVFFTADQRKRGTSVEAKAALLDSLAAYAGPWHLEGDKIVVSIDIAWNDVWKGGQQVRAFHVDGSRLALLTAPQPSATQPGRTLTSRSEWERID